MSDRKQATVYSYWDTDLSRWRHSLTKWDRTPDETREVLLPVGFDLYEAQGEQIYAYRNATEPRKENVYHDAWKVVPHGDGFALVDAHGVSDAFYPCDTVD